jgi:FlaA1/EpsC-like NDP-sugar epimerase
MGANPLTRLRARHLQAMALDVAVVLVMYYVMLNFRYAGVSSDWQAWTADFAIFAGIAIVVHLLINWLTGVYTIVSRYMSLAQAVRVGQAGILAVAVLFIVVVAWPLLNGGSHYLMPRSVVVGGGGATIIFMIGLRFSRRVMYETIHQTKQASERALLVGAGQAADMLIREIQRTPSLSVQVVGLVDDRRDLRNMTIQGFPVLGKVADVPELVERHEVTQIIVAIPSASAEEVARIYRICKPAGVPIKILPSLADLVSGTVSLRDARDLDIKDLLGRPKVETNVGAISDYIQGRTVLVTGAGGSIGSELCRQIARFDPSRLVVIDHDESALYDLHERLQSQGFRRYVLCPTNILQKRKLDKLFALHRPRLVFHAAAYKHVPLMELSPDEAVLNNVQGTLLVAETAARYGVERFVNISTDKAVEPCNVMGATKRAGELIVRMLSERHPETLFASVRFGNVLGSQGSVIPIFKSQIEGGGPLVITHPEMTRYFMLIEEAVQLVLQAAIMLDEDGFDRERSLNTFVLEMGDPVPIVELAQRMIDFYWQDQARSLGVEFSGLRPGEKLDEHLVYPFEEAVATSHPLVMRVCAKPGVPSHNGGCDHFEHGLHELIDLAHDHGDGRAIIGALMTCVPGYVPLDKLPLEKPAVVV